MPLSAHHRLKDLDYMTAQLQLQHADAFRLKADEDNSSFALLVTQFLPFQAALLHAYLHLPVINEGDNACPLSAACQLSSSGQVKS